MFPATDKMLENLPTYYFPRHRTENSVSLCMIPYSATDLRLTADDVAAGHGPHEGGRQDPAGSCHLRSGPGGHQRDPADIPGRYIFCYYSSQLSYFS